MRRDISFERAIAFASDLIQIPSLSGDEAAVGDRVLRELKMLRFDDVWTDEIGNVLARVKGREHGYSIMVSSHLDVVDAGESEQWEHPPLGGKVADGCLHGRGSMDCKGPLAIQTYAAASLLGSSPCDIYLAHTVFEEHGSWGMAHLMERGDVRPSVVVLGEATAGQICIGHRGRSELIVTVKGKAAHASMPQRGRNPIHQLPSLVSCLKQFAELLPSDPVLGTSTLSPSLITSWPQSRNMVPEEVRIVVDWRTLPGTTVESAVATLKAFLLKNLRENPEFDGTDQGIKVEEALETQRSYTGLERTGRISMPGFLLSISEPLVRAAAEAVHKVTGCLPTVRPWTFGTDGGYSCGVYAIPTIGYGPGVESLAHTNCEHLELQAAKTTYDAYPALLSGLQACVAERAGRGSQISIAASR